MEAEDLKILLTYAQYDMNASLLAKQLHYDPRTINRKLIDIGNRYGFNARSFWGLYEMFRSLEKENVHILHTR